MLTMDNVHGYYGKSHVLQGVSLQIQEGELVTLLGRNGAGKSTTLRAIMGALDTIEGSIVFQNQPLLKKQGIFAIARKGLCFVPENRGIFHLLTVEENLKMAAKKTSPWSLQDIYRIFPRLKERKNNGGAQLSGGEQQMLAIGRALMNHPKLLMLDEPVEGLAPVIVDELVAQIQLIKQAGVTVLLVEQNLAVCTQLADRHYIIEQGRIVHEASNAAFIEDDTVKKKYLSVGL